MKKLLLIPLVLMLTSCGELKIDGSSRESFDTSSLAILESRGEEGRGEIGAAFIKITASHLRPDLLDDPEKAGEAANTVIRKELHGMTAQEIIEHAAKLER